VRKAHFTLPVAFEKNVGQAAADVSYLTRANGATYLLTSEGVEILSASSASAAMATLQLVDAREEPEADTDGAPQESRPRKRKGSSGAKSHKPHKSRRKSGKKRSSHPRGASSDRPRDIPHPSAFDDGRSNRPRVAELDWRGISPLAAETNYFLGRDATEWRTHVSNFSAAEARQVIPGIDLVMHGGNGGPEYDLRVAPGVDPSAIRLQLKTAGGSWSIDSTGDLIARAGSSEIRMRKPVAYEIEASPHRSGSTHLLLSAYELEADGTVRFRVDGRDPKAELVIDPSLTVSYFSFLGGTGADSAASVTVDASGFVYVGGTTASARTIPSAPTLTQGPGGGASDFFIAKIDPTKSGAASLVYLTFIGGSQAENGGEIAIDSKSDVAIVGTTTSNDYPVTDGSRLTGGTGNVPVNDVALTEIDPTGATLIYSTLFGGNGNEATLSSGGIAIDQSSGNIFVGMDTTSTNLPVAPAVTTDINGNVTAGPFQSAYGGGDSDGFLAVFVPTVASGASHIQYCTYLGIYGQPTVTGVAVDTAGNGYLVGTTTNPFTSFVPTNGFQTSYGGDPNDGFVMKLQPSGFGPADLSYATFLGGSGSDQALAIAVSSNTLPGTAYVTGTTQSTDFPLPIDFPASGQVPPFQSKLAGKSNTFLAVISQDPSTFQTSLVYSTYLGGTQNDSGQSVWYASPSQIFVAGSTSSWDFPWLENLQPLNGITDAFVAELNPVTSQVNSVTGNSLSLIFATPLGGSASGGTPVAHGNAVAADAQGNAYVVGDTTAYDFPLTSQPSNGFQQICQSCSQTPPLSDAFLVEVAPQAASQPSVSFSTGAVNFGSQPLGSQTVPGQAVAVHNTGDAPLTISAIGISGATTSDFSVSDGGNCLSAPVAPGALCSFELGYVPTVAGAETGFVTLTDNGAGNPQILALSGTGNSGLTASPTSLNFGDVAPNPAQPDQMEVQLTNTGSQALTTTMPPNSGPFHFLPGNCTNIPTGATCTAYVNYSPTAPGAYSGQLIVTYPWPVIQTAQTVIALSGTSTNGTPSALAAPATLTFPSTGVGSQSASEIVTVTNIGTAPLAISSAAISGANPGAFTMSVNGAGACPVTGGSIPNGGACTISISFSPAAVQAYSASLQIADNASGSPQIVALTGSGVALGATLSTTSVAFGVDTVGIATSPVPVTLKNTGTSALTIFGVRASDPGDFNALSNCPSSLAAAATCTVSVSFSPSQSGSHSGTVQISDNAPQSPQTFAVSGSAIDAQMSVAPASYNFPGQLAGTASAAQAFTVTNTAASPALLQVTSAAVSNSADFIVTKNTCGAPVAAASTCAVSVEFDPGTTSTSPSRSGTLTIQSNAVASSPTAIALTGTAEDFELGPSVNGGGTLTVTGGDTATFNLDVTSIGGFTGAVALTCTGTSLPGTCAAAPSTINATANGQTAFQVNVGTSADAKRVRAFATGNFAARAVRFGESLRAVSLVFAIFWLVALSLLHRARWRRWRFASAAAIVLIFLTMALAACGSGGGATTDPPPASTYMLTVTATSGGATRTLPLTLTVD
jgi:hypothetical protein